MQRLVSGRAAGWAALAATVSIWAGYLIVARAAMTGEAGTAYSPVEMGLLRVGPAALLFLPVLLRSGLRPQGMSWGQVTLLAAAGGVAFVYFITAGLVHAPVADAAVFTPSMMPLFAAGLAVLLLGERPDRARLAGFGLILLGAAAVGGYEALVRGTQGAWRGHLLFLCASLSWALYTVAFRRTTISPLTGAAVLSFWAVPGFLLLAAFHPAPLFGQPLPDIVLQALLQGVLSGFLATLLFFVAITRLGMGPAAAAAGLVPGLSALGAWVFLAEPLGPLKLAGIAVVSLGVVLASGALSARGQSVRK